MSEIIPGQMTMEQALEIQSSQLAEWMPKLSALAMSHLLEKLIFQTLRGILNPMKFSGEPTWTILSPIGSHETHSLSHHVNPPETSPQLARMPP